MERRLDRPSRTPAAARGRRGRPAARAGVAPSAEPAAASASSLLATVPVHAPPPAPGPEFGGSPSGPMALTAQTLGGSSYGALSVRSVNPAGQQDFEPEVGPAGSFEQRRAFVVPEDTHGVVIQEIARDFAVRRGGATSSAPVLARQALDDLVRDEERGAIPYATHGRYFEAFLPGAAEDTFGMTSLAPLTRTGRARRRSTSGSFRMSGEARFYPTDEPQALLDELGFLPAAAERDTPANGLPERRPGDDLPSLDAIRHPYTGVVRHSVDARFDTFRRRAPEDRDLDTHLVLNGTPWVEPEPPAPAPAPAASGSEATSTRKRKDRK